MPAKLFRRAFIACGIIAAIAALAVGGLLSGIGNEPLRNQIESLVQELVGTEYVASIGGTHMSTDGLMLLGLEANDVRLLPTGASDEALHIGALRFGVQYAPLLRGELKVGEIVVRDSRVVLGAMTSDDTGTALPFFNEAGLFDADAAVRVLFEGADEFTSILNERDVGQVKLRDVALVVDRSIDNGTIHIESARLKRTTDKLVQLEAVLNVGDRLITMAGDVSRSSADGQVNALNIKVTVPEDGSADSEPDGSGRQFRDAIVNITGTRESGQETILLDATVGGASVDLKGGDQVTGNIGLKATMLGGAGKVEIDNLNVAVGRSNLSFHGAFGIAPDTVAADYRFELVSDRSTISPEDTQEAPLNVAARVAGVMNASAEIIEFETIGVRSLQGEVTGRAAVRLEEAGTALSLELNVADMPVGEVKQLWPWFSARSARRWVVSNLYGGRVSAGQIKIDAGPGRLTDGVPLRANELSGEFSVEGTRFDVVGRIPPVRDGNGSVVFSGMDVDIRLDSGTVFMPGGRTVDARDGVLEIRDASRKPLVGHLNIDVAGKADSILQLASYDPINVSRFIDIKPEELTGNVKGKIRADIPFARDFPIEDLNWRVDLSYDDLSVARAFEGQKVTKATGTIGVDPLQALIEAQAHLNGAPATIRLVEPLGSRSDVVRQRRVAMNLDNAARQAMAPGLNTILSGTARVEIDETGVGVRKVKAGLDHAVLSIPWIGWSKGSGVPATVSFAMEQDGTTVRLSDFKLSGETFAASGVLSLVNGDVQSINFPSAKLNRNDNFSVKINAERRGYRVVVRGKSIDVRSIIKLYALGSDGEASGANTGPLNIDIEVDSMSGFHGELWHGVSLKYVGESGRTDHLELTATTLRGQRVSVRDVRDGNGRTATFTSADAGSVLRFLDVYRHVEGGSLAMTLGGRGDGPLSGQVEVRDFWIVNEPRLRSLVSTTPAGGDRTLNQAVRGDIDTSRVAFERAYSQIVTGKGYLDLQRGVVRGPQIGSTFQGRLYDQAGNIDLTGTFMPAYGLNRIFGEIPLIGQLLGNGRDRGLIGITFRLAGKTDEPQLQVNPLSVIAPGIFRSVFEYR